MFGAEDERQGGDASERRKSSHRAVLEKKLSIAERAVATNPCSIALQLERLRICQELWEPSLLAKEWKKLVSQQSLCFHVTQSVFPCLDCRQCGVFKTQLQLWFIFFCTEKSTKPALLQGRQVYLSIGGPKSVCVVFNWEFCFWLFFLFFLNLGLMLIDSVV